MIKSRKWITRTRCCKIATLALVAVCCVWGVENDFRPPCSDIPTYMEIATSENPCCFSKNTQKYSFVKKELWLNYKYEAFPWECCFLEKPYRDYYYFVENSVKKWKSYRDSLLNLFGEQDYEMHFSRDSMAISGIEYENKFVAYNLQRTAKRIDSAYCKLVDSLENVWKKPYQKFIIPQEIDCREDILIEMRSGCFVWQTKSVRKLGKGDEKVKLCSHNCPGIGIDRFTDYKSLKESLGKHP